MTVSLVGSRIIGRQISANVGEGVSRLGQLGEATYNNEGGTVTKHFGKLHVERHMFPENWGLPFMGVQSPEENNLKTDSERSPKTTCI